MGLFTKHKKKEISQEDLLIQDIDSVLEEKSLKFEQVNMNNKEQRDQYVKACCDQIVVSKKELEDAKQEYNLVTTYLSDIQKIEELPLHNKAEVADLAREIVLLHDERKSFQNAAAKITDIQYSQIELNEEDIPRVLEDLRAREEEQKVIRTDMGYLEQEKTSLRFVRKDIVRSQKNMKGMALITLFTMVIAFVMLFALQNFFTMNTSIGYTAVVLCAAAAAAGIFIKMYMNETDLKRTDLKINRAVTLSNSTKIRYVNCTNALDYVCSKYNVSGAHELGYIWEQYLAAKSEGDRYKMNTSDLDYASQQLIGILHRYGVNAPSVWPHQALAIIENKEMVEVRHNLIVRRQNLRKRVEYNTEAIKEAKQGITKIAEKNPEYTEEIMQVINSVKDIVKEDQ